MSESIPISVIGSSECSPEVAHLAEEVGRELAKRGATVVCGGLGGVMAAVCKGAREAGGRTIGILPRDDPSEANPWVEVAIVTGIGYARNAIVVKTGWAVIAIDGGFGTLSEIGHALGQTDPLTVIGLNTWTLSKNGQVNQAVIQAKDPVDAVVKALAAARERINRTSKV
ncbi:MAG: TIGR00725 family protein [Dehalococcoidia bacterium]